MTAEEAFDAWMDREERDIADFFSEQAWITAACEYCHCCPECGDFPCDGALAGGICDGAHCYCYDDPEDDDYTEDYQDFEGWH